MRYINGIITGVVVGAAVGMIVLPQLDRKTQKALKRTGQKILNLAEDSYESIRELIW